MAKLHPRGRLKAEQGSIEICVTLYDSTDQLGQLQRQADACQTVDLRELFARPLFSDILFSSVLIYESFSFFSLNFTREKLN